MRPLRWLAITSFSFCAYAAACPQCYTQTASSGRGFIDSLRGGIFLLVVPTLSVIGGLVVMAWKRNRHSSGIDDERSPLGW